MVREHVLEIFVCEKSRPPFFTSWRNSIFKKLNKRGEKRIGSKTKCQTFFEDFKNLLLKPNKKKFLLSLSFASQEMQKFCFVLTENFLIIRKTFGTLRPNPSFFYPFFFNYSTIWKMAGEKFRTRKLQVGVCVYIWYRTCRTTWHILIY